MLFKPYNFTQQKDYMPYSEKYPNSKTTRIFFGNEPETDLGEFERWQECGVASCSLPQYSKKSTAPRGCALETSGYIFIFTLKTHPGGSRL